MLPAPRWFGGRSRGPGVPPSWSVWTLGMDRPAAYTHLADVVGPASGPSACPRPAAGAQGAPGSPCCSRLLLAEMTPSAFLRESGGMGRTVVSSPGTLGGGEAHTPKERAGRAGVQGSSVSL